jgi:protein involved in polysaccharide export with SLBB domain
MNLGQAPARVLLSPQCMPRLDAWKCRRPRWMKGRHAAWETPRRSVGIIGVLGVTALVLLGLALPAAEPLGSSRDVAQAAGPADRGSASDPRMAVLDDVHKLAPGDKLSFRILEDQEEPQLLVIKYSGHLDVPYIGLFVAAGKTCKALAYELKKELEKDYYHQATVVIAVDQISPSRGHVYLVGAVGAPGVQNIPIGETFTVGSAIMRAGGFTELADKRRVRITRKASGAAGDSEVILVNVGEIIEKGRTARDIELQPGDVIFVPERFFNF